MKIYKDYVDGNPIYKLKKETVRTHYKYSDTVNVDLSASNNTTHIVSGNFAVESVTAWSTTQTYVMNSVAKAKKVFISFSGGVQANAGWTVTITFNFSDGTSNSFSKDFGYGVSPSGDFSVDFVKNKEILSYVIYAYCYRRSTQYCYGSIYIGLSKQYVTEVIAENCDYYEDKTTFYGFDTT